MASLKHLTKPVPGEYTRFKSVTSRKFSSRHDTLLAQKG